VKALIYTIGVDPGASSGIAAYADAELVYVARVNSKDVDPTPKLQALKTAIAALPGVACTRGGRIHRTRVVLAVEDQFIGKFKKSGLVVARNAAVWQALGTLLGMAVVDRVVPGTWQATYGLATGTSERRAEGAREIALDRFPYLEDVGAGAGLPDVISAVLIATHVHMAESGWLGHKSHGVQVPVPDGFEWVRRAWYARQPKRKKRKGKARKAAPAQPGPEPEPRAAQARI
jgi:hypothetical protein